MSVPAFVFAGLSAIFLVFAVWMAIEATLLAEGAKPITWYIRNNVSWHSGAWTITAMLLVAGLAMAVTHFILDAMR